MPTDPANDYLPIETEFFEDGYHTYLNDGFDKLARDRHDSGPLADRPDAGQDFAPQWWFATDDNNGTKYYNTGSEWQRIPTIRYPTGTSGAHIQAAIDDVAAAGGGAVALNSTLTYSTTGEIHLKPNVSLQCNHARLNIDADVNGIFCDNSARIQNLNIQANAGTYTSDLVVLDTGRTSRGYGIGSQSQVMITGYLNGQLKSATGLHLIADTNGIGIGNHINIVVSRCGIGVHSDGLNSFVNNSPIYANMSQCRKFIKQTGGGGHNMYYGAIQPSPSYSESAIENSTSDGDILFMGPLWDAQRFDADTSVAVLQGSNITIFTNQSNLYGGGVETPSDGSANQLVVALEDGNFSMYDVANDERWGWGFDGSGNFAFGDPSNPVIEYQTDDTIRHQSNSRLVIPRTDLQTVAPVATGEIALSQTDDTTSSRVELAVAQNDGTWETMGGDTITPS